MEPLSTPNKADQAELPATPEEVKKVAELGGIQGIIDLFQKGELAEMVGAIMTIWKEYFGTPEEKAEIARQRKEQKEVETTKKTKDDLDGLHEDVDKNRQKKAETTKEEQETEEPDVEVKPYKPGHKKPTISPKKQFRGKVEAIYAQQDTLYTTQNLHEYFGRDYKKFMIDKDPVTREKPLTFLGRPVRGGINFIMLPFLKIAERKMMDQGLNYIPQQKEILGFQDRNMNISDGKGHSGESPTIPSFHKYGLAVDLDTDSNWPKDGRGNIPDEVMIAMAEAGFNLGLMGDRSAHYLINDPMHFQMRFPPDSAAGQAIIKNSPIGRKYWEAVQPMYEEVRQQSARFS